VIETGRLTLRPWREEDKPAFAATLNTPAIMRWFGGVQSQADVDAYIDRQIAHHKARGYCMWAVETRHDGGLVGVCGLQKAAHYAGTPVDGLLETGWRVAEPHWRRGIAREAAEAALAWGWANTDDATIAAWTTADNVRSWGLMERLGMRRRPDLAFHHPRYAADDANGAMLVYAIERP